MSSSRIPRELRAPRTAQQAEDDLEPLAQAGDTLHDYLIGTAVLMADGADGVDALQALEALTTAHRNVREAQQHLIAAMGDPRARLTDPLEAAAAIDPTQGDSLR